MGVIWSERFDWTAERCALLTKLWNDGLSASMIAAELGGISRNAVCGKIDRLGLPERRTLVLRKPRVGDTGTRRKAHRRPRQARLEALPTLVPDLPFEPADPVTLIELQDHHCRYPHHVPGKPMMYCGATKVVGAYCAHHFRIAYRLPARSAA